MLRSALRTVNLLIVLCAIPASAKEILTNFISFKAAPEWLDEAMVEKATGPIQDFLQWDIHRIQAYYHSDQSEFEQVHGMGESIKAFFLRSDSTLHLGPGVNPSNFNPIFSHEL